MADISAKDVVALRAKTGLPMMEVKKALVEAGGDEKKAIEILIKRGLKKRDSKSDRATKSGLIDCYLHDGRIGVMIEVMTETDFVAKNLEFKIFVHDLALHIASQKPQYISKEEIEKDEIEKIKNNLIDEVKAEGKPDNIAQKIVTGKINKHLGEICLLNQKFLKDEDKTVEEVLTAFVAKIGENIRITKFVRYEIGC